tara:strand:- start:279 stop:536 length:258 start_codon:yes stop_codon:yes gene_type:complete
MSNKKRKNIHGNYVCQYDYLSIRQKITQPKIKKNRAGKMEMIAGDSKWFVYHKKHKMTDPLKNKNEAIKIAEQLILQKKKYVKHN